MNRKRRLLLLAGLLAAALLAAAAFTLRTPAGPSALATEATPMAAAARTTFPGLVPAAGEPDLPALHTVKPPKGQATQIAGPFDDRLVLENLAFNGSAATGAVRVTSDVSDVLELQVLAGFYDHNGALLGTARFVHHLGSESHNHAGPPEERETFSIAVPAKYLGKAVSAAVGVPVLVNE
jgi:hypothetical protein